MPKPVDLIQRGQADLIKVINGVEFRQTSASNQFAGISTIASGSTTVVVSTTVVKSDSGFYVMGFSNVASHRGNQVSVQSITDGSQFTLQANLATVDSYRISWAIFNQMT